MKELAQAATTLIEIVERLVPRILTQVCRDPHSVCYGACDRDWWHYRTKDFSSVILQQAGLAVYLAGQLPGWRDRAAALRQLAEGTMCFWRCRALQHHAFEEYYPWESGYPPLAFSTLSMMRLLADGVGDRKHMEPAAQIAARQLLVRLERQAGNQQVAGLAAVAWIRRNYPEMVAADRFEWLQERTMELQAPEGWFMEYGGPDTGYLSVTLDCLWDLYDATRDESFLRAADRALDFLWTCVSIAGSSLGMHNSRNTDYVLPYGIVRFMANRPAKRDVASALFLALYGRMDRTDHFLRAVDDRYLTHYTGQSLVRACLVLQEFMPNAPDFSQELEHVPRKAEVYYDEAGLFLRKTKTGAHVISLGKGGILSVTAGDAFAHDFGWRLRVGGRQYTSHWWSLNRWDWSHEGDPWTGTVKGTMAPVNDDISTTAKHGLLRVASLFFGPALIRFLKGRLIFREAESAYGFQRRIEIRGNDVAIRDEVTGLPENAELEPAPRASKRHVASADSFHPEDVARLGGFRVRREVRREGSTFVAETTYSLEEEP